MLNKLLLSLTLVVAAASIAGAPRDAVADSERPPVSIFQARKISLARVPGTIVNEKLKTKKKKPPIWSIKIRPRGLAEDSNHLFKIEVDATTGTIVKVKEVKARKHDDD